MTRTNLLPGQHATILCNLNLKLQLDPPSHGSHNSFLYCSTHLLVTFRFRLSTVNAGNRHSLRGRVHCVCSRRSEERCWYKSGYCVIRSFEGFFDAARIGVLWIGVSDRERVLMSCQRRRRRGSKVLSEDSSGGFRGRGGGRGCYNVLQANVRGSRSWVGEVERGTVKISQEDTKM